MLKRRRFKQTMSLKERLSVWAEGIRAQAAKAAPGTERDDLLKRARQADTAAHIDEWVNSPGLRPPT